MSETAKKIEPFVKMKSVPYGSAPIAGKIKTIERKDGKQGVYYITTILVPAASTEEYPKTFSVFSNTALGKVDDYVDLVFTLQSRRNQAGFLNLSLSYRPGE